MKASQSIQNEASEKHESKPAYRKHRNKPLKVFFCDLTYDTIILVSDTIPINIGFIASYAKKIFNDDIEVELFKYPNDAIESIKKEKPDLVCLSNYSWNSHLSEHVAGIARKANPNVITAQGGPNLPHDKKQQIEFIKQRFSTDIFMIFEGEKTFCTYEVIESGHITQNIDFEAFKRSKRYNINDIEFNKPYPLINAISFNKFKLDKKSKESLMDLHAFLKENEKLVIKIVSHTDNLGTESYNARLSKKRAESVVKFLASEGISKKRLSAEGKGESEPIAPNTFPDGTDNEKGREKNRRTEFIVTGILP